MMNFSTDIRYTHGSDYEGCCVMIDGTDPRLKIPDSPWELVENVNPEDTRKIYYVKKERELVSDQVHPGAVAMKFQDQALAALRTAAEKVKVEYNLTPEKHPACVEGGFERELERLDPNATAEVVQKYKEFIAHLRDNHGLKDVEADANMIPMFADVTPGMVTLTNVKNASSDVALRTVFEHFHTNECPPAEEVDGCMTVLPEVPGSTVYLFPESWLKPKYWSSHFQGPIPSFGMNFIYCDEAVLLSMPMEELEKYEGIVAFFAIYNIIGFEDDPEHPILMCFMEDHIQGGNEAGQGGRILKFQPQLEAGDEDEEEESEEEEEV